MATFNKVALRNYNDICVPCISNIRYLNLGFFILCSTDYFPDACCFFNASSSMYIISQR